MSGSSEPLRTPVPAIDVHTHLFPERLAAAVRRALTEMYGWSFDLSTDPHELAAFARNRGTERFVLLPYAYKPGIARFLDLGLSPAERAMVFRDNAFGFLQLA